MLSNVLKKAFLIFFYMTLRPFMKFHSLPCFPSRNIKEKAETHPPPMRDVIIEQSRRPRRKGVHTFYSSEVLSRQVLFKVKIWPMLKLKYFVIS